MAGIYIHIPFCKSICHYCDFYKSTNTAQIAELLNAMYSEIEQRKNELKVNQFNTIYIGGGTPSLLSVRHIDNLLENIFKTYTISNTAEITMECNPDDLSEDYLKKLSKTAINRLSIGTQSFQECNLKLMNRRHKAQQAINAVTNAKKYGFNNISIDLIYGIPNMSIQQWKSNIKQAIKLNVQHISAYHLTYHEGTVFYNKLENKTLNEISENNSFEQFNTLRTMLLKAGFKHYEISNFAKDEMYSKHNMAYWQTKQYLGFGPSAHSYSLNSRRWNISSVNNYIELINNKQDTYFEIEQLSLQDKYNDYIITSLRTQWGLSDVYINCEFGENYLNHFYVEIKPFIESMHVETRNNTFILTEKGFFISDTIMEKLCLFS